MYQIIDEKDEQQKYNQIVDKITPQSLGLKPTTDFAQYAQQTLIDENPAKVKEWIDKGSIGVMEAGRRFAYEFDGTYDNVISREEQIAEFRRKHPVIGESRSRTVEERIANNKRKIEERNKRVNNGTASILDRIGAGLDRWGNASYNAQVQHAQQQADAQMPHKGDSNYRYTPVAVDKSGRVIYNETDLRKKIDFTEALADSIGRGKAMPFVAGWIEGSSVKKYRDITGRIANGEAIRQDELDYVNRYIDRMNEEYIRGYTIGGKIGDAILPSLLAFGSEIMLGGAVLKGLGLAGAGKSLGVSAGANLLKTGKVSKNVAKGIAFTTGTVAESGLSAGVTTAVNPARIYATYQERRLNDEMKITDRGTVIFQEAKESPAKALFKSLGQVYIAYFTEGLGGLIGAPVKGTGNAIKNVGATQFQNVIKANPALEKLVKKTAPIFAKAYEKLNKLPIKGKSAEWLKGQVKFDGFIEELGEEVLEDVLNLAIGTNNEERSLENYVSKIVKTPEEWAVLCGVIALQGTALSVAGNTLGQYMQSNGSSFEDIANVSANSTEAEKIELLDEAIKRGDIKINESALYDEIEAQKEEVEEQAYNKLLKGGISEDVALANSKLFGQFFKRYGAKSKEAFNKWFNKLEVQYNVTPEETKENLRKQAYQSANTFDRKNIEDSFDDTVENITNGVSEDIKNILIENDISEDEFKFEDIRIYGSYSTGKNKESSDLDFIVQYSGSMREDDAFNMFHDNELTITDKNGKDVVIDINPINTATSGTIADKMQQMNTLYQSAEDRNLIMTHATKSERLDDILANGSLVAPSMAITKKGQKELSEKNFGDILLIRDPELINYKKDNIYDRDIYSPRLPAPAYKTKKGGFVSSYDYDDMQRLNERDPKKFEEIYGRTFEEYFEGAKKVIFDGYTPSGNRKIIDYNSKNLVKWVKREGLIGGENWHYGLSSFLAKLSSKQTSKKTLKKSASISLQDRDEAKEEYDKLSKEYTELLFGEITKYYKFSGNSFQKISDEDFEDILFAISQNNERLLSEYIDTEKLPKELYNKLKDFVDRASKLPRSYFEAKPLREVSLTEFSYALAEKGTISDKQKKELAGWGIKVVEYEDGKINEALEELDNQEEKIYFQESDESEEKLIAGFTYPEVLDKLTELYDTLGNATDKDLSQEEQDKLMTKIHVLEDAFEVAENSQKFNNEDQRHEIMLNAYYVMNNQEIPEKYVEADKISQRTYRDYVDLHKKKKEEDEAKYYGYFTEGKDKNIVTIMSNSNASTALHELGHLFLNGLNELARADENASKQLEAVNKWLGYSGEYTVAQQEKFARSFEAYLYKGKAPNNYLREVFENFKEWLRSVYTHITELVDKGADISDEVTELFDNMFSDDEYYQERKEANELLKRVKNISRREKLSKVNVRDDSELDEVEKRHKNVAYDIVSVATGKSVKYLKTIFETGSGRQSFGKKRESIEMLLDQVDDKITVSGGMREEWKEFYSDTGVSYDNDEIDGDYKLFEQALDTIINKSYRNPEKEFESEAEARAEYYMKAIDEADRQYKVLIRSYEKENRNVALSAIYEWIEGLDKEIKQDYEDRFIYDSVMIDRKENVDKFDKAKRQILSKALEVENRYSISKDEKYKEVVKEIMKNLNFLNPSDKAKLTTNILDVPSVDFLMSSIDNIMDIAKTMEDVNYRRKLEMDIHKELQQTKNIKKNGRTVGKYDYKTNKIFEELRELDKLTPEQANELRLEVGRFATAEDNGLSYKDKLINKFLSYKSGGRTFADTELMKELYDEILRIKFIGKSAKSELDLQEKLSEGKDIEELIDIVQKKKDGGFFIKHYIDKLANLESTLNAIFNKDIKDRYGSEILYAETQAQAWQYKVKTDFEKEVANIYNLPLWCWDKKILEYLGEKHTYSEIRRKYDTNGDLLKSRLIDRTLTKMDIIQAYIWSKNQVLEKRLINQFGDETLYAMFDELSLEDVKFAELMMRTAQSFYPMVNRAFIQKYGLDLPKVSCYFPSTPERGSEVDLYNDYSAKSLNNSFTKARAQSETQAMDFHNPVATLYNHIEGVAKFALMTDSLDRANLRFKDLDLKRVIINKYGKDAYSTLEQALINVTYKKEAPVFNGMNKIIDNMVGNWIQANVAIKPIVGLKQLLSANNYAVDMPYMTWQVGFLKALANPKATIDYMMNIPYIKARYGGSFSNEFLKQTVENSAFALSKKLKDSMNMFIKMGDIGAIIFGGKPYIDYLIKEKGMSEEQAIKQFILSTNRSQQSSAVSSLSNFQVAMTRNPVGKLFIAFKNSPQQYIRMCGDAIVSVANGDMSKTQCAKYIFQFAYLQPFLYASATSGSLFRFLFTGDDDDLLKDLKMSIFNLNSNAVPILGDIYQYALNKLAYKEKQLPQTTPLLGDIEQEINKISKEDVSLSDYLEAVGYMLLHVRMGYNSKAIGSMASGVGDIVTGDVAKGSMKVLGYTEKRAKNITKEETEE